MICQYKKCGRKGPEGWGWLFTLISEIIQYLNRIDAPQVTEVLLFSITYIINILVGWIWVAHFFYLGEGEGCTEKLGNFQFQPPTPHPDHFHNP